MKGRLLRKAVATAGLSVGLMVVGSPMLASAAHALPVSTGTSAQTLCYWDGKAYSAGAKKTFNGEIYTCQADGSWKKTGTDHPAFMPSYSFYRS